MFVWLLACQQSVFQRYHSEKHLSFFPTRWRRKPTGIEITSLSPYVCNSQGSVRLSHRSTAAPATDGFANCCWVPCGAGRRSIDICGRRAAGAGAQQQMRVALSREPTKEASIEAQYRLFTKNCYLFIYFTELGIIAGCGLLPEV